MTRKEAGNTLIDGLPHRLQRANMWIRLLLLGGAVLCLVPVQPASGESTGKQRNHVEAERAVFNGKGACSLTDQELADTLAFLALLRQEGAATSR
ncbi:MAG: hypothetical protein NTNFB02_15570 [Nitrospira sp.]